MCGTIVGIQTVSYRLGPPSSALLPGSKLPSLFESVQHGLADPQKGPARKLAYPENKVDNQGEVEGKGG